VQFDELPTRSGDTVLVAAGELLVKTEMFQKPGFRQSLRQRAPYWTERTALEGALTRITVPDASPKQLGEVLADLRVKNLEVTANAVLPAGSATPTGVWKAQSTPEPAPEPYPTWQPDGQGEPVKVVVIDTGVHAQLRTDKWLDGLEVPDPGGNVDPLDDFPNVGYLDWAAGHGTMVAGIIRQLAPDADLVIHRVLDSDGLADSVAVAEAMVRAVKEEGAQVINLSLGIETHDDEPPLAFTVALDQIAATGREVVIVAAAGNSGMNRRVYPAACDGVTAVAAQTETGATAAWSSRGKWVACSAVGEKVRSTYVQGTEDPAIENPPDHFDQVNSWALWTGTSFAAPQVAGAVARDAQHDGIGVRTALDQLLGGAPNEDPEYGKLLGKILL
jgi:subtilisin family serine protease